MVNASELGHSAMRSTLLNTPFKPKPKSYRPEMRPGEDGEDLSLNTHLKRAQRSLWTTFPGLLTKRIGNIVVFPALCKPRYAGISQNSSKTPLPGSTVRRYGGTRIRTAVRNIAVR